MSNPKKATVIKPVIESEATLHPLISEATELTSIGMVRTNKGWVSYIITSKGDKILSVEAGEPNMKAIVLDETKIAFVTRFVDSE